MRRTVSPRLFAHLLGAALAVAAGAIVLVAAPRTAAAYPQFQLSSGTQRCGQCHYSPNGFGLITSWGRSESADTISTFDGNGDFLHGLVKLPKWLALGGDVRLAITDTSTGGSESPELASFPMQTELYGRVAFGESGVSLYTAIGLRGTSRDTSDNLATRHFVAPITREHYLMWRPSATGPGPYVRLGRFYAPYGLRLVEHIYFVRRYAGFGLFEETYNVSGGYADETWEVHGTLFTPPPESFPLFDNAVNAANRGSGGAVLGEMRFAPSDKITVSGGAQGRISHSRDQNLLQGGLLAKLWVAPAHMLVLGELDLHHRAIIGGASNNQLLGFLGLTFFPTKGVMAGLAGELFQDDLRTAGTRQLAADLQASFFPWAHIELMALGRYVASGTSTSSGDPGKLLLLQLHYYL